MKAADILAVIVVLYIVGVFVVLFAYSKAKNHLLEAETLVEKIYVEHQEIKVAHQEIRLENTELNKALDVCEGTLIEVRHSDCDCGGE